MTYANDVQVSFGDCDPAGIVFYPNFFAWIDRTFHALMRERLGGHARLCRDLGAQGIGLMDAHMAFRSPATEGDLLRIEITGVVWEPRRFAITYQAHVRARLVFEAEEIRGLFIPHSGQQGGRLVAGDVGPLKALFQQVKAD